jgi:hypothetical protein
MPNLKNTPSSTELQQLAWFEQKFREMGFEVKYGTVCELVRTLNSPKSWAERIAEAKLSQEASSLAKRQKSWAELIAEMEPSAEVSTSDRHLEAFAAGVANRLLRKFTLGRSNPGSASH